MIGAALLCLVGACHPAPKETSGSNPQTGEFPPPAGVVSTSPTETSRTVETTTGSPVPQSKEENGSLDVSVSESGILIPARLHPGTWTFTVKNRGTEIHSLVVASGDYQRRLDEPLSPGESGQIVVDLGRGRWRVWCPVDHHAEEGESTELLVS